MDRQTFLLLRVALVALLAPLLAIAAAGLVAAPQQPQPTPPAVGSEAGQTIRAAARLVEISVVALDRSGRPVADLRAEEFTVREDGKPQEVAVFQVETLRLGEARPELPPGVHTNRLEQKGAPAGVVTVILLDGLNTEIADQNYARRQVLRMLEELRPEDRVAIYTFGRTIRVLHDFTSDAAALRAAVERFRARAGGEVDATRVEELPEAELGVVPGLEEWIQIAQERRAQAYAADRARATAAAMEAIAGYLERIPGRKNLVWVSSGFPFNLGEYLDRSQALLIRPHANLEPVVERAARALNNANVAVYPVDARGLVAPFDPALQAGQPAPSRRELIGRGRGTSYTFDLSPTQDSMERLAQLTGGRTFLGTNDLAGAIREAIDESAVTYTLAYYPTHGSWDGKFRQLRVEVARPGVRLRHRRGYYAFADAPPDAADAQRLALEAAASPLDATAIGITARLLPISGVTGYRMEMEVDAADLTLSDIAGRRTGALTAWFVLLGEAGEPTAVAEYPIEISLDEHGYRTALTDGIRHARYMEFPPEARALRIVVREAASGAMGSLRVPLPKSR